MSLYVTHNSRWDRYLGMTTAMTQVPLPLYVAGNERRVANTILFFNPPHRPNRVHPEGRYYQPITGIGVATGRPASLASYILSSSLRYPPYLITILRPLLIYSPFFVGLPSSLRPSIVYQPSSVMSPVLVSSVPMAVVSPLLLRSTTVMV